jgi:hypothetical protein
MKFDIQILSAVVVFVVTGRRGSGVVQAFTPTVVGQQPPASAAAG